MVAPLKRLLPVRSMLFGLVVGLALVGLASGLARAEAGADGTPGPTPAPSPSSSASAVVSGFYDALLAAMKDGAQLKFSGRAERLSGAVSRAFDLAAMTRLAAGAQWQSLSAEERSRLVEAFSQFSVANYAANFDSFSGERFEVGRELPAPGSGSGVIVETQLIPASGEAVQLNYLLRPGSDGLRIIDVFVNGTISELATRRSEFASLLNNGGAEALRKVLETRSRELATK